MGELSTNAAAGVERRRDHGVAAASAAPPTSRVCQVPMPDDRAPRPARPELALLHQTAATSGACAGMSRRLRISPQAAAAANSTNAGTTIDQRIADTNA